MSRKTISRLQDMLCRSEKDRAQHKRDYPSASAVREQMRRDENALRDAIAILTDHHYTPGKKEVRASGGSNER